MNFDAARKATGTMRRAVRADGAGAGGGGGDGMFGGAPGSGSGAGASHGAVGGGGGSGVGRLRVVDYVALLACAVGVVLALQGTRSVYVVEKWSFSASDVGTSTSGSASRLSGAHAWNRIPLPIVADLDGDGLPEVVVATAEPALLVLDGGASLDGGEVDGGAGAGMERQRQQQQQRTGRGGNARLLARVSLLSGVHVSAGRMPVAMAVGFKRPADFAPRRGGGSAASGAGGEQVGSDAGSDEGEAGPRVRRQLIVVLTDGWVALCFNARLRLKWEVQVNAFSDTFAAAGSSFAASDLFFREAAARVVPIPMGGGAGAAPGVVLVGGSVQKRPKSSATTGASAHVGVVHGRGHGGGEGSGAGDDEAAAEAAAAAMDADEVRISEEEEQALRHFSVYALDVRTGKELWRHEGSEFPEMASGDQVLMPQHQYKLSKSTKDMRNVQKTCTRHRKDVVTTALPHSWHEREDTRLNVAHFERRRHGSKQGHGAGASKGAAARHVDALHSVLPFSTHTAHQEEEHIADPNVVLLHGKHGVEVLHLFSGTEICRQTLTGAGSYADVNGDGVIDHVEAIGAQDGWAPVPDGVPFNPRLPGCIVKVSSGSPPIEQLYNGSLCHSLRRASLGEELTRATVGFGRRSKALRQVEIAPPVVVPVSLPKFHGTPAWTCFFASPGIVTCFDERGKRAWQTDGMDLGWKTDSNSPWAMGVFRPSLSAMSVFDGNPYDEGPDASSGLLLAVGDSEMSILSVDGGSVLLQEDLDWSPVLLPVVGDLDGDGITDVLLVSPDGVTGYLLGRSRGSLALMVLVFALMLVLGLVLLLRMCPSLEFDDDYDGNGDLRPRRDVVGRSARAAPVGVQGRAAGPWYTSAAQRDKHD